MSKKLYIRCLAQANSDSFYRFIESCWWTHDVRVQVPSAPLLSPEVSPQAKWKPALQIGTGTVKCPNAVMLSKCCPNFVQMLSKHCFDFWRNMLGVLKRCPEPTASDGHPWWGTCRDSISQCLGDPALWRLRFLGHMRHRFHPLSHCLTMFHVSHRFTSLHISSRLLQDVTDRPKSLQSV